MEEQEKICRLCLKTCENDFQLIEENATKILVFLQKSDLFISEEAVMCGNCTESIKDCSNFKRLCLDVEDSVVQLINCGNDAKVKETNEDDHTICRLCMGSLKICSSVSVDSKLEDVTLDQIMLNKCLPELDLRIIEKPIICVSCRASLQHYFGFITNFLIIEEKIKKYCEAAGIEATGLIRLKDVLDFTTKNTLGKVDRIKMEEKFCGDVYVDQQKCSEELNPLENISTYTNVKLVDRIKIEEILFDGSNCKIELQSEDLMKMKDQQSNDISNFPIKYEEDDSRVDLIEMKQLYCPERVNELELKQENLNSFQDCDILPQMDTNFNLPKMQEYSLMQPYRTLPPLKHVSTQENALGRKGHQCNFCSFETKHRNSFYRHQLIHKNSSKIYHCELCSFKTKHKQSVKIHLLTHKNPSEITMHQCEHCSFQTIHKQNLRKHLVNHTDPSEIIMYQCEHCPFQTKQKEYLKKHSLNHKDPSEITMYQCKHCLFQTKHKGYLKKHLLNHKNPSEITMYRCEHCLFQTKYKGSLKSHLLIHEKPSEIIMNQCEYCSFQTKHKQHLKNHLLTHKNHSKIIMFQCEHCVFQTKHKGSLKKHLLTHKSLPQ